jgi:hypothetical protein
VCPKCNYWLFKKDKNNRNTTEFFKHVKECKGEHIKKELLVKGHENPYLFWNVK